MRVEEERKRGNEDYRKAEPARGSASARGSECIVWRKGKQMTRRRGQSTEKLRSLG